jgi:hypothetical protein
MSLLHELKVVFVPWTPWKAVLDIPLCSHPHLYLFLVLPFAALGPLIDTLTYILAPFHSAMMPEIPPAQLSYNTIRDVICGVVSVLVAAKIIQFCSSYNIESIDSLRTHHLAALAIIPAFLAIAVRPFVGEWAILVELLAIFYGGYLLAGGMGALLGWDRVKSITYALVISLNMLLFSYVADWAVIRAQLLGVQFSEDFYSDASDSTLPHPSPTA